MPSYSVETLLNLIGNASTDIPDDINTAAPNLMKANCTFDRNFHIGYYSPALIRWFTFTLEIPGTIPLDRSSINIHPLNGHWVTSFYMQDTEQLYVYDSFMTVSHLAEVSSQLEIF